MSDPALRVLIADDEPVARRRLQMLCDGVGDIDVVGAATDGVDALRQIAALSPDLVLLDIAMPDLDGMGVAKALSGLSAPPAIIFCTAFDRHALAAFDVSALDYLLKPIARDRLARAIEKARRHAGMAHAAAPSTQAWIDHLWVPHRGAMLRVDVSAIRTIEAEGDYVRLSTATAGYMLHETMTAMERRLEPGVFVRLRRSIIVRGSEIEGLRHEGLGSWSAALAGGGSVRIGPTYLRQVRAQLRA